MNFQEVSRIFRLGFAQAALEDGATTGQVPKLGAGGEAEFGDAGGGSTPGTPQLIGPIPLLFSDIPNSGDTFDLLTLPVGSALIDWWIDPDTVVPFSPDNNDTDFGQGAGWAAEGAGRIGRFTNSATGTVDATRSADSGFRTNLDGTTVHSPLLVTKDASPIQAQTWGGGAPFEAGSIDLYFLVVTPPFGTP